MWCLRFANGRCLDAVAIASAQLVHDVLLDGHRYARKQSVEPLEADEPLAQHVTDLHDQAAASFHVNFL